MKKIKKIENSNLKSSKNDFLIRTAVGLLFFVLLICISIFLNRDIYEFTVDKFNETKFEKIRVLDVLENNIEKNEKYEGVYVGNQVLDIEVLTGEYAGDRMEITHYVSILNYNTVAEKGMKLYARVYKTLNPDTKVYDVDVTIYSYNRMPVLIGLTILFIVLLVLIGGKRGFMSLLGLVFTLLSIVFVMIPLLLRGWQAIPTTILILTLTTAVCYYLLGGFQAKTYCAFLGTLGGVILAGILSAVAAGLCHVDGSFMEEAESLYLYSDMYINVKGLFISGILIASVGAIMDVAVSISSSIDELYTVNRKLTSIQLFKSGMNIGKDAMGTMSNTLILAFSGSYINTMMYLYKIGQPMKSIFNDSNITMEIIRGIAGTIGIIATVPLVAAISSILIPRLRRNEKD